MAAIGSSVAERARGYILYGVLYDAVYNLWRPFAATYLTRLGGGPASIFLYNYLPALFAAIALLPSLFLIRRWGGIGRASTLFLVAARACLLPAALLPWLPESLRPWAFVAIVSIMAMPDASSLSAIQAYVGTVFGPGDRASAIARRLAWGQPVVLLTVCVSGIVLKFCPGGDAMRLHVYQAAFLLAACLGALEIAAFGRLRKLGGEERLETGPGEAFRKMRGDRRFLAFFGCSLAFNFGWMLGWPLFTVWQVNYLGADEAWLAAISIAGSLVMFLSYGYWRRLTERRGLGVALAFSTLGQSINPVIIALCGSLPLQLGAQLFMGFFTAGVTASLAAGFLGSSPETSDKVSFAAIYNVALYLCQVVSQSLGQLLFQAIGIRAAMCADGAIRLIGAVAFIALFARRRPAGEGPAD